MKRLLGIIVVAIGMYVSPGQSAPAQEVKNDLDSHQVQFKFSTAPWRSVIEWLAESGDYALHVNDLPLGSFTYSDERFYTHDEAINRINMFLIPQRYTLVRSEKLLSVISLVDETSVRQLDSMARTVAIEELKDLGSHEFVKCLIPLGEIAPEHAIEELSSLLLIREPSVLPNTNQLMVLDTAGKLRMVNKVLGSLAKPDSSFGPVKRFALGGLDPEKTLVQVRPHVGLDPLAMTGADVRLSIDKDRRQLLASGSNENLQAIASVIALLQESDVPAMPGDQLIFRPHDLGDADMQTVVNVLQTLLAEEDVRMAPDAGSNQLAILANPQVHELVDKTIKELSGRYDAVEFKVIEVNAVDARYAAIVLNDMFASQLASVESEDVLPDTPRIDADSASGRLFVRARKSQLAEIESALLQFRPASGRGGASLRLLPYHGEQAKTLLDSARKFWPYEDEIEVVPSTDSSGDPKPLEREIESNPQRRMKRPGDGGSYGEVVSAGESRQSHVSRGDFESTLRDPNIQAESVSQFPTVLVAAGTHDGVQSSGSIEVQPPPADGAARIRVQQTPGGLLVHCDNAEAIQRFEEHLKLITGSRQSSDRRLAVFYLKHAKIDDANALLRQLLADESLSASGNPAGLSRLSLPQSMIDVSGGLDSFWGFDSATVIPDKRLNRLFVYGSQSELDSIEEHLQVIDRENSIADLKTRGTPRMILLHHAEAEAVATVIRDTYSGRIASTAKERNAAAASQNRNQQPRRTGDQNQADSGSNASLPANVASAGDEDKMTLAVDVRGNSIVVTAPSQLADEVEKLARAIDDESKQTVQVIPLNFAQMLHVQESLKNLYGDRVHTGAAKSNANVTGR